MMRHSRLRVRAGLLAVAIIVLIAGHGIILYYFSSHVVLSTAVVSGVIMLVVIKHLGLLGSVYALFRRRARRDAPLGEQEARQLPRTGTCAESIQGIGSWRCRHTGLHHRKES